MAVQKLPLFSGLIKSCHDGLNGVSEITQIFTPPDKTLLPGSQAFYALHLWIKPAAVAAMDDPLDYEVRVYRGSVPADVRPIWVSNSDDLIQPTASATANAVSVQSSFGVPVKILDGYPVRGDMYVTLASTCATLNNVDQFDTPNGTRLWGYYERLGQEDGWRFIGEPPAGPLFDTGMPIAFNKSEKKIIHTFESNRFDEVFLQLVAKGVDTTTNQIFEWGTSDSSLNPVAYGSYFSIAARWITGAPNALRDPKSIYTLQGVFGGNPAAPYFVGGSYATNPVYVHGKFSRH